MQNLPEIDPSPFEGSGEVRRLMRTHDWTGSPLGPPAAWPQALRTVVDLILDSSFPMFVAWGPSLGFLYNDAYVAILGNKHPAAVGQPFGEVWAEIWPEIWPIAQDALAGKSSYFEDLQLMTLRHGYLAPAWFTFSYSPLQDGHGLPVGIYCTVVETTGRVLAEQRQLFQLQIADRMRELSVPEDIMAVATDMLGMHLDGARVTYVEVDEASGLFRIAREWAGPLYGPRTLRTPQRIDDFGLPVVRELRAGRLLAIADVHADPRTAGHAAAFHAVGVVAFMAVPLVKADRLIATLTLHRPQACRWTDTDVLLARETAERTWSAVERARAESEVRDANRRKDEFLAMLAHELRNPLAPISAAAELLVRADLDGPRLKKTSQIVLRQVRHMRDLIDDLLDVSRVTSGLVTIERQPLDLKDVVAAAVEQVRPAIQARRHHLAMHLAAETTRVSGDAKRLVQVLSNLLHNAAKYTPEGGHIVLTMEAQGDEVLLRLHDDGIGMDPQLQLRVFDLFAQAERTPDRAQGGLGLGLALAKSLCELHGGALNCFSGGLGQGSTFTVQLPRLPDARAPGPPDMGSSGAGEADAAVAAPVAHPLTILVVDDNVDAAQMLGMLLEAAGHRVLVEFGSIAGLARAMAERPDVCLLDLGLPDMDGNALASRLRASPRTAHALLVAVTGYGQERDRQTALAAGFDHHLVKPVAAGNLTDLLAPLQATRRRRDGEAGR